MDDEGVARRNIVGAADEGRVGIGAVIKAERIARAQRQAREGEAHVGFGHVAVGADGDLFGFVRTVTQGITARIHELATAILHRGPGVDGYILGRHPPGYPAKAVDK